MKGLALLAEALQACPALHTLKVHSHSNNYLDKEAALLMGKLLNMPSLRSLDISGRFYWF